MNPGESLGVLFDLLAGVTYADTLVAMVTGELRIGIHVQGFASGGSESFINPPLEPPATVPVPAAVWLFGSGLLCLAGFAQRHS